MKKIRKFLYSAIMAVALVAIALFASACGSKDDAPAAKYTLKFMNGTAVYDTVTATAGSAVEYKPDPTRANLVFDGWSLTENGTVEELPSKMPAEDRTYYAVFSARYKITLRAGECGTLPAESTTLSVKAGVKLYDLISDAVPAVSGDAKFDAWFYNGVGITAQSETLMPAADISVEAKYTVEYELNEYKQVKYGEDSYGAVNKVTGRGYVGDYAVISNYVGYEYNETSENDGDKVVTVPLAASKSANSYNVYYSLRAYNIMFNANMSGDITVNGKMENDVWGYNEENTVPECLYSVAGYRFIGWSDVSTGSAKYFVGDRLSVTRATVLYAIWSKGYTDMIGQSSDYIFVIANAEGKNEVYLRRSYISDMKGEFNESNNTFVFKNSSNQVILRGIVYPDTNTYAYLDTQSQTVYALNERKGEINANGHVSVKNTVDNSKTLTVKETGDLIYDDGTNRHNGTLSFDQDANSMVFDGGKDCTFRFRLTTRPDGDELKSVFEIRDENMYGIRYGLNQNGTLDATTYVSFDGYGGVVMYVIGYNSLVRSKDTLVVSTAGGYYAQLSDNNDRADVCISLYKNDYVRTTYLAFVDSDKNLGNNDNPIYKVFAERILNRTVYAAPADPKESGFSWENYLQNADTARIVLDGYGMFDDSAVYTYKDAEQATQTVSGRYLIDTDLNELVLITAEKRYTFRLSYVVTDEAEKTTEILFNPIDVTVYTSRPIIGLDNVNLNLTYRFRLVDGTRAEFAFSLPVADKFFGIYEYQLKLTVAFGGEYREVGKDADNKTVYEFIADGSLTDDLIKYIFTNYYYTYSQKGLDTTNFRQFKFKSTVGYLSDGSSLDCFAADGILDGYKGITLKYDGVTYTLDGYGVAVSENSDISNKKYSLYSNFGMSTILALEVQPKTGSTAAVIEQYAEVTVNGAKTFMKIGDQYNTNNGKYMFRIVMLEDGYALLGNYNSSTQRVEFYSFGKLVESDGLYKYTEIESATAKGGIPLLSVYGDFAFRIVTAPSGTKVGFVSIEDKLQTTLKVAGVGVLTVNKTDLKATFTAENGTAYTGTYRVFEDILEIVYTIPADGENKEKTAIKSLKLEYGMGADVDKVVSFKEVGTEAGTWWNYDQLDGTMVLSGYYDGEMEIDSKDADGNAVKVKVKTASAVWTYYNESSQPVSVTGKYYRTGNTSAAEYCFVYTDKGETATKLFALATDNFSKPIFKFRAQNAVYIPVYKSMSDTQLLGIVMSDGYFTSQMQISSSQALPGVVAIHEEAGIISFAVNSSTVFYFGYAPTSQTAGKWVLLDQTITAPNYGTFASVDGNEIEIDGKKVTSVRFTGYGIAFIYTAAESGDPQVAFYSTIGNTYFLYKFGDDDSIQVISAISLRVRNNGENVEDYVILFADKDLYDLRVDGNKFVMNNTVKNSDGLVLVFDGFGNAVYVDGKGVRHSAVYVKTANPVDNDGAVIVQIVYVGENGYEMIVAAIENGEFTIIDEDDPRYPQPSENETEPTAEEQNDVEQNALPIAA